LVPALALAACGGGDSDEDKIADAIETTATTTSDENCTELQTQRFVEQTNFETGQEAIEQCKEEGAESNADSTDVSKVEVNGDKATAEVAITGSTFDGQNLVISLVKEDDQWKLDHIDDIIDFDLQAFADAFEEVSKRGEDPFTDQQAKCVADNFASAQPETVKSALLSGDASELLPAFEGCGLGA
jgi:hypothetical protein